jgi:TolB-like protein
MPAANQVSNPEELSPQRVGLVRDHLKDVLASNAFAGSKRAQEFLQLIVGHALAGELDSLRERMIGAEMFGRPIDYDAANDAVVRVRATEARRKLAQYYRDLSKPPVVRIDLPSGSYVPKFYWESAETAAEPHPGANLPAESATTQILAEKKGTAKIPPRSRVMAGSVVGLILVVAIGYIGFRTYSKEAATKPEGHAIAVLPIQNLSGDPRQDYFADGMTDELIADLGQVSALRVISRTSVMTYKGTKKMLPQIARELGVDKVVEGSAMRVGNQVRVTAQLIDARTDQHLWSHSYIRNLNSVLALQGEVAQTIAAQIRIEVTPEEQARLARTRPAKVEAQDLYLQGKYHLNLGDPSGAIGYFQQALAIDPDYAPVHAALADTYGWMGEVSGQTYSAAFAKQKAEAIKAIELDKDLPEGHAELAKSIVYLDWDWATAEKEFKRALELNPNAASIHFPYSRFLEKVGRIPEALAEDKLAVELDPVSSRSFMLSAPTYYYARQYDQALAQLKQADELNPNPAENSEFIKSLGFRLLALIYTEKSMYEEAIRRFRMLGDEIPALGHLGNAYARAGRFAEARATIAKLEKHRRAEEDISYHLAVVYAGLGEKDEAFAWLQKSYKAHDRGLTYLKIDPCIDPLRSDPRLNDLMRRVGLPVQTN